MALMDAVVYQLLLLWLFGLIAIGFSFILPTAKNRRKVMASHYARAYLLLLMVAQTVLTFRLFNPLFSLWYAYAPLVLAASYCVLFTVLARFGEAISPRRKQALLAHLLATSIVFTLLSIFGVQPTVYAALMVVNSGAPIVASALVINRKAMLRSTSDKVLLGILSAMSMVMLLIIPCYLWLGNWDPAHITTFGFMVSCVFMLIFMLGFGSSVMYELVQKLNEQTTIDPLTKAKNRRYYEHLVPQYESAVDRKHGKVSLIACDIDHFKDVNDKYGHDTGDHVLCHFVKTLGEEIRAQDVLIRMGGEEFLIFCPSLSEAQAFHLAERLRKTIAIRECIHGVHKILLTASFGVATFSKQDKLHDIVKLADKALYRAKSLGRNRVVAAAPMQAPAYEQ